MFQQKTRPRIRGKLRGTLARRQRRAYRTIPNTRFVRVFLHGDSDAETQRIARVVRVVLGLDFSAGLAVATIFPVRKSRAPRGNHVGGKAFTPVRNGGSGSQCLQQRGAVAFEFGGADAGD